MNTVLHAVSSARAKNAALLTASFAIFFWQLRNPVVRFASPLLNDIVGLALGLGLPWLIFITVVRIQRWWSNTIAIIALLPLLLYSLLSLLSLAIRVDRVAEIPWKASKVVFYRIDGGATTPYEMGIQQERALLPGLLLVRTVDAFARCDWLDATPTESGFLISTKGPGCESLPEHHREYRLKSFVYF